MKKVGGARYLLILNTSDSRVISDLFYMSGHIASDRGLEAVHFLATYSVVYILNKIPLMEYS